MAVASPPAITPMPLLILPHRRAAWGGSEGVRLVAMDGTAELIAAPCSYGLRPLRVDT